MSRYGNGDVNSDVPGAQTFRGSGGTSATDIQPVWETEALPQWVNRILIPLLASGQAWPKASESGLWAASRPHKRTAKAVLDALDPTEKAVTNFVHGWDAPGTPDHIKRVSELFGMEAGAGAVATWADGYAQQFDAFARETQYSKISINVSFWVAITAAFIAMVAAFFSAGTTAWLVGPYAAAARQAVSRILEILAINAGRGFVVTTAGRLTTLSAITSVVSRLMASPFGREAVEEIGEEAFIDLYTQRKQWEMGTRTEWDWKRTLLTTVGAGFGAGLGMRIADRISRLVNRLPGIGRLNRMAGDAPGWGNAFLRFPGRALSIGANNMIVSPASSVAAELAVNQRLVLPGPEAFVGGFMGGLGRPWRSPFDPDVAAALLNPSAALDRATDLAARSDLERAVNQAMSTRSEPPSGPGPSTPPGSPTPGSPTPDSPTGPVPAGQTATPPAGSPATPQRTGSQVTTPGTPPTGSSASQQNPLAASNGPSSPQLPAGARQGGQQPAPQGPQPDQGGNGPAPANQQSPTTPGQPTAPGQAPTPGQPAAPAPAQGQTGQAPTAGQAPSPSAPAAQSPDPGQAPDPGQGAQNGQPASQAAPDNSAGQQAAQQTAPSPGQTPDQATGQTPGQTASPATAPANANASADNPATLIAQRTVADVQRTAFAHGLMLDDGGMLITDSSGRVVTLTPEALRRVQDLVMIRTANGATPERLRAAAAAALGTEIAVAAGRPPAEGAMEGLDQLAHVDPKAAPHAAAEGMDVDTSGSDRADRLAAGLAARAPAPDAGLRPGFYSTAAQEIADRLAAFSSPDTGANASGPNASGPNATGPNAATTSRLGTVTAGQISQSLFQHRRPAHHGNATVAEVHAAVLAELTLAHFGGHVLDLTWPQPSDLLVVETRNRGTLHYRVVVAPVGDDMARSDGATGTATDPIIMRVAPRSPNESLARAVLHEVSHRLQDDTAAAGGRPQGVARRWLSPSQRGRSVDSCVLPRLNEFRLLSDKWRAAATMDERNIWAHEINRVLDDLRERGQTPPLPPWSGGQHHTSAAPTAPDTPLSDLTSYVRHTIDSLGRTVEGLTEREEAKRTSSTAAMEEAVVKLAEYYTAQEQRDRGAAERTRKAWAAAEKAQAKANRHGRIADNYQQAREYAEQAREAYEKLLSSLEQGTPPTAEQLAQLADQAQNWLTDLQAALREAAPPPEAAPSFVPADRLPHLNRLTRTVNEMMWRNGIDHTFTPDTLERVLSEEFSRIISGDGALVRVGRGTPGELLIHISATDLVEVLGASKVASEIMNGVLPQGGRSVGASANYSQNADAAYRLHTLIKALPEGDAKEFLKHFELSVSPSGGHAQSLTGSAGNAALPGGVADDRVESVAYDAAATWTVRVRTAKHPNWSDPVTVSHGDQNDPTNLRVYVSHAYMEPPPPGETQLDEKERGKTPFPENVALGLTGLVKLADDTARALGEEHFPPGSVARRQLYTAMIDDLYGRIDEAVNDPSGLRRIIHVNGKPFVQLQIKAVPRLKSFKRVGTASEVWQERLRVEVVKATGNQSSSRSRGVSTTLGVTGFTADAVPGDGEYAIGPSAHGRGSVGASVSDGLSVEGVTYHPSVQRFTGRSQGEEVEFDYVVTGQLIDSDTEIGPITGEGKGLFRFAEKDAHEYGMPVDAEAFTVENGERVYRDDGTPDPPEGRKAELPPIYGNEPGKVRGAGPGRVGGISEAEKLKEDVKEGLRRKGILAPIVDGKRQYSKDPLERVSQMLNEEEIDRQIDKKRLQSGYNQATADGIPIKLVVRKSGRAPQVITLNVTLEQHFTAEHGRIPPELLRIIESEALAHLPIGSDTNVWSHSRTENAGWGAGANVKHVVPEKTEGVSPNVGVGGGRDYSRTTGHTQGLTINYVGLYENGAPLAAFAIRHTARVEILHADGTRELLAERDGTAEVLISSDLLPPDGTSPFGESFETPAEMREYLTAQQVDTGDLLEALQGVLDMTDPDSPAYHHLAELANSYTLTAHPEMFTTAYGSNLLVRPQGLSPSTGSADVRATIGDSTLVGVVTDVNGKINLTLASMGVTSARSHSGKVEGSAGVSHQHADGSSEGGKVGGAHSGGESRAQTDLAIWGRERLAIETGNQYVFTAKVAFDVTGGPTGAEPVGRTADGTLLYTVPERHVLRMYAEGTLNLPLAQMADVVERFLDGTLKMDRSVAVPLVKRYLEALQQSPAPVPLADRHTPAALIAALKPLVDAGSTLTRVDEFLMRATEIVEAVREAQLPSWIKDRIGHTLIETARLQRNGEDVQLLDAVREAVASVSTEALSDAAIPDSLRKIFSNDRWVGPIDTIFSEEGLQLRYYTPFDALGRREEVVVKVRGEFTDDPAIFLEHVDDIGGIWQDYTYLEEILAETRFAGNAVNAGGDRSGDGHGSNASVRTDRGRSATGSAAEQETRIQRVAMFKGGMERVSQKFRMTVEVERTPQQARPNGLGIKAGPTVTSTPIELDGTMVRLIPNGFVRIGAEQAAEPARRYDPRQVTLPQSFAANSVRTDLHRNVVKALKNKKLLGDGVEVLETELLNLLSETATTTLFERMNGEQGHEMTLPVEGLRNRVVKMRVKASATDMQVLARGVKDVELGDVWRIQRTTGSSSSGGMAFPIGGGTGMEDSASGLSGGVSGGEQASVSVSDGGGIRREMTRMEKDDAVIVRLTTHYDLTMTRQALTPEGPKRQGNAVHIPGAATGEAIVIMSETDYQAMTAILESGGTLGPEWQLSRDASAPAAAPANVTAQQSDPARPWTSLLQARVDAIESGRDVLVRITEPDRTQRVFLATPQGRLIGDEHEHDSGFAEAFATLSPELVRLADDAHVNLRQVYEGPRTQERFALRVLSELVGLGVDVSSVHDHGAIWPTPQPDGDTGAAGSVSAMGSEATSASAPAVSTPSVSTPSVNAPEVAGSAFVADGRAPHLGDVTLDELKEAVERDLRVSDFGGKVLGWTWSGSTLVVETESWGTLRFEVSIGEVTPGNVGETDLRTRNLSVPPRTANDQLARAVLHEISHAGRRIAADAARSRQGVLRRWMSALRPSVGRDDCVSARFDEFRYLSRRWVAAKAAYEQDATPQTFDDVRKWEHALRTLGRALLDQGQSHPSYPWSAGRQTQPGFHAGSIGALPTTGLGLGTLADLAGVTSVTPAGAVRASVAPVTSGTFTVSGPAGDLTLDVAEADLPPGQVAVRASEPGRLSVAVSPADGSAVRLRVAELIAEAVAAQAGLAPGDALVPGPLNAVPQLRRGDAATLVRIRALIAARAEASLLERGFVEDRLRTELNNAGLMPGTEGATARQVSAARAGLLPAAHLDAINEFAGRAPHHAVAAAVAAVARAATLHNATATAYGSALVDVTTRRGTPILVEVVLGDTPTAGPVELTEHDGVHVLTVNRTSPVPLVERAVAVTVAGLVATASGVPRTGPVTAESAAFVAKAQLVAELHELIHQVRSATPQQRAGRFDQLVQVAEAHGLGRRSPGRDANRGALPGPLAVQLVELLDHSVRGESRREFWERMRRLANGTGWWLPEEELRRRAGLPDVETLLDERIGRTGSPARPSETTAPPARPAEPGGPAEPPAPSSSHETEPHVLA
ncbi:WXG100-like domain-containing protein [Nonomuraea indica]|uniref:Outer membrane channel protein CpnT-like N-terminal domain-containing protein n=1 Tax=Nonomuraea indica TaxID=1581193 RepID=A0ABW8A128_9ACTN